MKKKIKNVRLLPLVIFSAIGIVVAVYIANLPSYEKTTYDWLFILSIPITTFFIGLIYGYTGQKPFTHREVLYPADPNILSKEKPYYINGDVEAAFLGSTRSSKLHVFGNISSWPKNEILILTSWQVKSYVAIHEELTISRE